MAIPLTNKATLNYVSGSTAKEADSNTASVMLQGPLEISKRALEGEYHLNDVLTYSVIIKNTSNNRLTNLTIKDDLGAYQPASMTTRIVPLSYVGPTHSYVNSIYSDIVTPTATASSLEYTIPELAGNATLLLQYKVMTNKYALGTPNTSKIINTVTVDATGLNSAVTASYEIGVASYADLRIEKTMQPNPVIDGDPLTYTFVIKNYGTIDATTVILNDTFTPAPDITTLKVDGTTLSTDDYDYSTTTGIFRYPTADTSYTKTYTIPKADFQQDSTTGEVTILPGTSTVVIVGDL